LHNAIFFVEVMSTPEKNKKTPRQRWIRLGLITLICLPLVIMLLLLTTQTTPPLSVIMQRISNGKAQPAGDMAKPDTSTSIEHQSIVTEATADTTYHPQPSTEMSDERTPSKSGTEDGYWDGYYDGSARQGARRHFNDSSAYSTSAHRQAYSTHYAEGYDQGYTKGKNNQ
jgi:hypothetical protein